MMLLQFILIWGFISSYDRQSFPKFTALFEKSLSWLQPILSDANVVEHIRRRNRIPIWCWIPVTNKKHFVRWYLLGELKSQLWYNHILFLEGVIGLRWLFATLLLQRLRFDPCPVCLVFMGVKVALVQVFLCVRQFYPVSVIAPVLCTHSFSHHRRCIIFTLDSIVKQHTSKQSCVFWHCQLLFLVYMEVKLNFTWLNYSITTHCTKRSTSCKIVAW